MNFSDLFQAFYPPPPTDEQRQAIHARMSAPTYGLSHPWFQVQHWCSGYELADLLADPTEGFRNNFENAED